MCFSHQNVNIVADEEHIFYKVNNSRHEMIRRDLGDKIMEISHTNGTDRWLVVKKELDASNVSWSLVNKSF